MDKCDAYGHFAVKCVELARTMDSPRNRSIMLQMALIWLRLAEYAAKTAARKECTELISPATVDGERNSAHWVKVNNPNAPAVIRPLRVGEAE